MIEDIELNDNISETTQQTLAQQEITIDNVLNSNMVTTAMDIFKTPTSPRVNNKI
jgi:hypothetical protein